VLYSFMLSDVFMLRTYERIVFFSFFLSSKSSWTVTGFGTEVVSCTRDLVPGFVFFLNFYLALEVYRHINKAEFIWKPFRPKKNPESSIGLNCSSC
jgi:hypothetical protein